jgi:hypothetical protein
MSKSRQITKKGKIQKLVSLCYRFRPKEPTKETICIYCQILINFIKQTAKVDFEKWIIIWDPSDEYYNSVKIKIEK